MDNKHYACYLKLDDVVGSYKMGENEELVGGIKGWGWNAYVENSIEDTITKIAQAGSFFKSTPKSGFLTLVKSHDIDSAILSTVSLNAEPKDKGVLFVYGPGKAGEEPLFLTVTMEGVYVKKVENNFSGTQGKTDTFTFTFRNIIFEYKNYDGKEGDKGANEANWKAEFDAR
ncbi:MAG: type VI secretion system tube protein Hcp [Betaproteobacteria bacterium]|nr:type VI secretion system tube protein Hcp [Betaproteobacteria bacterium]